MARRRTLSISKNALYTSLAALALGVLVVGTRLSAANVVKTVPNSQSFHLIGFGFIWIYAIGFFLLCLWLAWSRFRSVPDEERLAHPVIRKVTLGSLLLSLAIIAFEALLIMISIAGTYLGPLPSF